MTTLLQVTITTAGAPLEFDTQDGTANTIIAVDTNHFLNIWRGSAGAGRAQVLAVNTTTWVVTTSGSRFTFDAAANAGSKVLKVDTTHFVVFWSGNSGDGFVQIFQVNTTTWAVTTSAAALEFDTVDHNFASPFFVDANHVVCFYRGASDDNFVEVFTINTTTWAVTTAATRLEFDTQNGGWNAAAQIDTNHFVNFSIGGATGTTGNAQVFTVNTTTWAVTTAAAALAYDTQNGSNNRCAKIDTNHFINFWQDVDGDGVAQVFAVNTTTWAVTTSAGRFEFDTQAASNLALLQLDATNFLLTWQDASGDGVAQAFTVDTSTWAISTTSSVFEFDTQDYQGGALVQVVDNTHALLTYGGAAGDGFAVPLALAYAELEIGRWDYATWL